MFLCLIQLIGGLTPRNGARKRNFSLKIFPPFIFLRILGNRRYEVFIYFVCIGLALALLIFRWDYLMEGNNVYRNLNPMVAYEKGLITWAKWVDMNLDPRTTRIIFRSMSPRHNRYGTGILITKKK